MKIENWQLVRINFVFFVCSFILELVVHICNRETDGGTGKTRNEAQGRSDGGCR